MEKKIVTDNNISVFSYTNDSLHSFCISLYVRYGCIYESDDENGLAHFLEHITFRNINNAFNGELYRILDKCGLTFNASTYMEFIHFYITGSVSHFGVASDIITKALSPLSMPSAELELERKRIKAEIREEDYRSSLECFSNSVVWKGTTLERSICGTCRSVDRYNLNRLNEYQKDIFNSNNIFFYVTGAVDDFQIDKLVGVISAYSIKQGKRFDNVVSIPEGFGARNCGVYLKNSSYTIVRFNFDVVTSKYEDAALELFFDLMFSGESCVIFQNLSEKSGLIYGYDARFSKYNNIGNIYFSYEVQSNKVEETVRVVIDSLRELKEGIGDRLEYVFAPYVDNAMILFDNPEEFNWNRAYENHILCCNYPDIASRVSAFAEVSADTVCKIARDVLRCDNIVITLKGNKNKISCENIRRIAETI